MERKLDIYLFFLYYNVKETFRLCEKQEIYMKNNLERLRKERKIGQEQLAKAMGVSRQTIGSIENGRYNPSIVLAIKIARYFGKAVEEIFMVECESRWLEVANILRDKNANYKQNIAINQPDEYVLNQNSEPWNLYKYGKCKFGFNGGEIAAVYNICRMFSMDMKLAEILLEFEANDCVVLGGFAGTDPKRVGDFFAAHGMEYTYCQKIPEMHMQGKGSVPFIITYWVTNKLKELKGLHAVAGVFNGKTYTIYNGVYNSEEIMELTSLNELVKKSQVIGVYLFKK